MIEALLGERRRRGRQLADGLAELPHVVAVRGRGLMLAAELDVAAPEAMRRAAGRAAAGHERHRAHLAAPAAGVERSAGEVDEALARLGAVLED